MTHSSGIPALAYAEAVIRHAAGASDTYLPIASDEDMLTFVNGAEDWVHSPPGARWFYLNGSGYPMAHIAGFALAVLLGEDPWTLPGIREERALERLTGRYETYRGTYGGTVKRAGDFLVLEIKNRLLEQSVPLVPVSLEPERARFFTLALGRRLMVEFEIRDGGVDLIYERYRMRRTGSI